MQKQNAIRILIVGEPEAGKTTFTELAKNPSKFPSKKLATDGISITKHTFNNNDYIFWDFGGQEVLFSTHQFFLTENCQYLLVIDLSKLMSNKKQIKNKAIQYTEYWMKEISKFTFSSGAKGKSKNIPPILLGTHSDLISTSKKKKSKQILIELALKTKLISENETKFLKIFTISNRQSSFPKKIPQILLYAKSNSLRFALKLNIGENNNKLKNDLLSLQYLIIKHKIYVKKKHQRIMWGKEFENKFLHSFDSNKSKIIENLLIHSGTIITYRSKSSASSNIIILDPIQLAKSFTSIISIKFLSTSNKQGIFDENQIYENFKLNNIPNEMFFELEQIFGMFNLLCKLPSGKFYSPGMLHAKQDDINPLYHNKSKEIILNNEISQIHDEYFHFSREYQFNSYIPFGFIDKLIVRILNFPNMEIHPSTLKNDFYLKTIDNKYHILIQMIEDSSSSSSLFLINQSKLLKIQIYFKKQCLNHFTFSILCHFIFQSPKDLVKLNISDDISISEIKLYENNLFIGKESEIIKNFTSLQYKKFFLPIEETNFIPIFNDNDFHFEFNKFLGFGGFGNIYKGLLISKSNLNDQKTVVFKQLIKPDRINEFIHEVLLNCLACFNNSIYNIKLLGICSTFSNLIDKNDQIVKDDQEKYLMVLEFAPLGDFTSKRDEILKLNSTCLKIKIAFDVARGLCSLYSNSGMKLIHRDVRAPNVFLFSIDVDSACDIHSIHAKLGDFGAVVIASPSYSERIGCAQYAAPEAIRGNFDVPYTQKVDIFSFGILFWEILTGKIPYKDFTDDDVDIESEIPNGLRPDKDLKHLPSDVPDEVKNIILSCWESNPVKRPEITFIIETLEHVLVNGFNNLK